MSDGLDPVLKLLADDSRPIRTVDLSFLSDLPRGDIAHFNATWASLGPARRLELVSTMVDQAEANIHFDFHAILRGCLTDPDAAIRRLAVDGLWEDDRPSLISPLAMLLAHDLAPDVRAAAASSLGRFVLKGVLGEIAESSLRLAEQALRAAWLRPHEVTEVRRRVLESLAYLSDPEVYDLIDTAYYDEDELMRQSAVFAMGRSTDRRWAKPILAELSSESTAMRFEAAVSAGELGLMAAVYRLIQLLGDVDGSVREAAALALGKIGGRDARRALEIALEGDDERLVQAAEDALEELAFNEGTSSFEGAMMHYRGIGEEDEDLEWDSGLGVVYLGEDDGDNVLG